MLHSNLNACYLCLSSDTFDLQWQKYILCSNLFVSDSVSLEADFPDPMLCKFSFWIPGKNGFIVSWIKWIILFKSLQVRLIWLSFRSRATSSLVTIPRSSKSWDMTLVHKKWLSAHLCKKVIPNLRKTMDVKRYMGHLIQLWTYPFPISTWKAPSLTNRLSYFVFSVAGICIATFAIARSYVTAIEFLPLISYF